MIKSIFLIISLFLGTVYIKSPVYADSHEMTSGVVRKIDSENGKITIKHGPIANLDMPPMSMVFTVKDPSIIADLSKGDKVAFVAAEEDGKLYVTEIKATE